MAAAVTSTVYARVQDFADTVYTPRHPTGFDLRNAPTFLDFVNECTTYIEGTTSALDVPVTREEITDAAKQLSQQQRQRNRRNGHVKVSTTTKITEEVDNMNIIELRRPNAIGDNDDDVLPPQVSYSDLESSIHMDELIDPQERLRIREADRVLDAIENHLAWSVRTGDFLRSSNRACNLFYVFVPIYYAQDAKDVIVSDVKTDYPRYRALGRADWPYCAEAHIFAPFSPGFGMIFVFRFTRDPNPNATLDIHNGGSQYEPPPIPPPSVYEDFIIERQQ